MAFKSIKSQFAKVKESLVNEEKKGSKEGFSNSWEFKPKIINGKDTEFKIRFLPIETPTGRPWIEIRYHMFERAGDNKYIKCIDPRTFDTKAPNPIADLGWKLYKSDNPVDQDQASKYMAKRRYFTLVYVKQAPEDQKQFEGKVLVYEAGTQVYNKMKVAMEKFNLCFYDPFEGTDFILSIKETGTNKRKYPSYQESDFARENGPISDSEEEMERIETEMKNLNIKSLIIGKDKIPSEKQLKEYLEGGLKSVETEIDNSEEIVISTEEDSNMVSVNEVEETPAPAPAPAPAPKKPVAAASAPAPKPAAAPKPAPAPKPAEEEEAKVDDIDINFDDINIDE
jgi:cell division septation protein DedD